MEESITHHTLELKHIDENTYENSLKNLNIHMKNKEFFKSCNFDIYKEADITEDFSFKNKRQSYYFKCRFTKCGFKETGFSGSVFVECEFIDCDFSESIFQSCIFRGCQIYYNDIGKIRFANFSKSVFSNCKIYNISFETVNFGESVLEGGSLKNICFRSVVLENATIKKVSLKNMQFASQNFDFLTINDISTDNVVIPFPASPNIINGLDYLYATSDNICFTSCGSTISKEEYLKLINDFEIYYTFIENYFPLANIFIAQKRLKEAIEVTLKGICLSLKMKNYRMIYQYCKLVQSNPKFTIQHKKYLYDKIQEAISSEELYEDDYIILNMYIQEIKELLLNSTTKPYLLLDIKSNIDYSENQKIAIFIGEMENLIDLYFRGEEEHYIEIRHNSPENFIIQIVADPEKLIAFLASFFTCIDYTHKLAAFLTKKGKENKIRKKLIDKEESILKIKQNLENCNISIVNVNYNIVNSNNINQMLQSSGYLGKEE